MLYGTAAMASLWVATALLARWPLRIDFALPVMWPALLGAVFLAWTQALTWMPYGLPGLRVIVAVLGLTTLDAVVFVAVDSQIPEAVMVAFLAPQLPLAYLAARYAVARARRGDVPDWRGLFAGAGQRTDVLPRRRDGFVSPARAQLWFEWRQHGWSLPAWVGILLPFELGLLFIVDAPVFVLFILIGVLLTPPFMAAFVAATMSAANPHVRDSSGVPPFTAMRPMTGAALVAAKLKMAIWSTLAAWLLVVVAIPMALALSGTGALVIERARQAIDFAGAARVMVIMLLCFGGLVSSTWKKLVQSLYIGLTGREWLIKASALLALSTLVIIGPLADGEIRNRDVRVVLFHALPWIPLILVGLKMPVAAWIAIRLYKSRLLSDRTLMTGAACWLLAVIALYSLLVWLVDTPLVPRHLLGSMAILAIPLVRVSAAPLALAWNRHR